MPKTFFQPVLCVYWVKLMYFGSHLNFFQLLGIRIMERPGKWRPNPVFLPGESQGNGSLIGCRLWGWTQLKRLSNNRKIWDYSCVCIWTSQGVQVLKNTPTNAGDKERQTQSLGWQDPLEEGMITHSSIPAWRIPRTEEPDSYSSQGCTESDTTEVT